MKFKVSMWEGGGAAWREGWAGGGVTFVDLLLLLVGGAGLAAVVD